MIMYVSAVHCVHQTTVILGRINVYPRITFLLAMLLRCNGIPSREIEIEGSHTIYSRGTSVQGGQIHSFYVCCHTCISSSSSILTDIPNFI